MSNKPLARVIPEKETPEERLERENEALQRLEERLERLRALLKARGCEFVSRPVIEFSSFYLQPNEKVRSEAPEGAVCFALSIQGLAGGDWLWGMLAQTAMHAGNWQGKVLPYRSVEGNTFAGGTFRFHSPRQGWGRSFREAVNIVDFMADYVVNDIIESIQAD